MFFFNNRYQTEEFEKKQKDFEISANNDCYPLQQSNIQSTRMNYVPLSVKRAEFEVVKNDLRLVYQAIVKLLTYYQQQGTLAKEFGLSCDEAELFEKEDYGAIKGVLRFDLLYSPAGFKVVEIDADPDALFLHDMSFNALATYFPKNYTSIYPNHFDLYKRLMDELGVVKGSTGLILLDPKVAFREEYEINRRIFDAFGYHTKFLPYDETIRFDDFAFVKRAYEFHRMMQNNMSNVLKKLQTKKCVNPVAFRLIGYKNAFMYLHTMSAQEIFTDEERDAVARLIPKTEVYKNDEQRSFLLKNKDRVVIKPILGAEGVDVFVGNILTQDEWEGLFVDTVRQDGTWLFQELVDTAQVAYQDQSGQVSRERYFDFSPHMFVFKDELVFGKNLVRYSDNKILNVAQGGSFGYGIEV